MVPEGLLRLLMKAQNTPTPNPQELPGARQPTLRPRQLILPPRQLIMLKRTAYYASDNIKKTKKRKH